MRTIFIAAKSEISKYRNKSSNFRLQVGCYRLGGASTTAANLGKALEEGKHSLAFQARAIARKNRISIFLSRG